MGKIKNSRYISLFLAAGIAFTGTCASVSAAQDSNTETLNILSRVIESENNGLLRYSYVNEDGKQPGRRKTGKNTRTGAGAGRIFKNTVLFCTRIESLRLAIVHDIINRHGTAKKQ